MRSFRAAAAAAAAAVAVAAVALTTAATASAEDVDLSRGRALQVQPAATCASANVPQCTFVKGRTVVFLLDSSNSLDKTLMQTTGLDYIELLYCAFATQDQPQAALISFAAAVTTRVPLGSYTSAQWFAAIEAYRPNFALSCCTPTAEAFDAAQRIFSGAAAAAGQGEKPNQANIWVAFTVSDGVPYQNSNGPYAFSSTRDAAVYSLQIVPTEAQKLKNTGSGRASGLGGVRLVFVGVRSGPVGNNRLPNINYFAGIPTNGAPYTGSWQCQTQAPTSNPQKTQSPVPFASCKQCFQYTQSTAKGPQLYCGVMNPSDKSLWPIVSQPVSDNLVAVENFDLSSLITSTVSQLCSPPATLSPTTRAPTNAPTQAPIKLALNHLDLFLLLDRSYSIQTDAPACRSAPGSNPQLPDSLVCWDLIQGFAKGLVTKALTLGSGGKAMGWSGQLSSKLGLRVTVIGFACSHKQTDPLSFYYGENIVDQAGFDAAMAAAAKDIPFGGTCPGAAAQRMVRDVQFSLGRPNKALVLITDGVTYDGNNLEVAAKGFDYFNVLTFSVGIGLPLSQYPGGLKAWQLQLQKKQLANFVNGDKTRMFNLGAEGYSLLNSVSDQITQLLPSRFQASYTQKVLRYPYFCGAYSNQGACEDPTTTGAFCKWNYATFKCGLKARCDRPKFACAVPSFLGVTDPCCQWNDASSTCGNAATAPSWCGKGQTSSPHAKKQG